MKIINLDQLKTLILIKGGERNVGRSLPSFIFSHNFVSILFLSHLPHRAVLLTNNLEISKFDRTLTRRPTGESLRGDWCRSRWKRRQRNQKERESLRTPQFLVEITLTWKRQLESQRKSKGE